MAIISTWIGGKGVNKDLLPAELDPGTWSDCSNFRFCDGFDEKFQGLTTAITTPVPVEWLFNYATTTTRFVIEGGVQRVYAFDGTTHTEITRYTEGAAIASITRVGTTATLTTATPHGRTTSDTVTVYGALPSQYSGTFVVTVTAPTTFTYVMAGDPGASATTLGLYSFNGTTQLLTGSFPRDGYSGGSLNGVHILNAPLDGLFYWAGDTTLRIRKFPASNICETARPFKNYIIQLASTVAGVKKPHNVAWSAAADPGALPSSFTAAPTNDAGNVDLADSPGFCIDGAQLGDVFIVYKKDARWAMQYIGGNSVFSFRRLPGNHGVYARDCVVDTPKGHVFLSQNKDVLIHQGGEATSIAQGRMRTWLLSQITDSSTARAFLLVNPEKNEVWVCFTVGGGGAVTGAAVWNWNDDTWGIFDFTATPLRCGANGLWPTAITQNDRLLVVNGPTTAALVDSTNTTSVTGTLERRGMHFGDRNSMKILQRSRWAIDDPGVLTMPTVTHGSTKTADATAVTYSAGGAYTAGVTNFVNDRATAGRYCAIKMSHTGRTLAVRSIDMDVNTAGTR